MCGLYRGDGAMVLVVTIGNMKENTAKISGIKQSVKITDHLTCTSANVI